VDSELGPGPAAAAAAPPVTPPLAAPPPVTPPLAAPPPVTPPLAAPPPGTSLLAEGLVPRPVLTLVDLPSHVLGEVLGRGAYTRPHLSST